MRLTVVNDLHASDLAKAAAGVGIFAVWVGMRVFDVSRADDIISFCQVALTALTTQHLTAKKTRPRAPRAAPPPQ